MKKPLLIEIGVEELPAVPFLKELPNIKAKWQDILDQHCINSQFDFFYTPRRLIIAHKEFPLKQDDKTEEFFGAPLSIAYKDGSPTQAALGFAKKCGVDIKDIKTAKRGDKEVLYFQKSVEGKETISLLEQMLESFLKSLNFGKSMRWGDLKDSFIRPVRWIGTTLGDEVVNLRLFEVNSSNFTYPHRSIGFEKLHYKDMDQFLKIVSKNGVIIDPDRRKEMILKQFKEIENQSSKTIQLDNDLLEEVVAITENPTALMGEFDKKFLNLPPEVIILSMREHQRYFPVFDQKKLSNNFIVVSNSICDDYNNIVQGNEKVLRARLSDALFFYENDLKRGLSQNGLENINFIQGGGNLLEKSQRERDIALTLSKRFDTGIEESMIKRVFQLSKADLLSDMVYEFTELQGLMGYYYAKEAGEDEMVALAIKEQYLPSGEDSLLPSTPLSSLTAMSLKLDTLLKLFEIGHIPTGTKDPFGLRRAVIGIFKIALNMGYHFDFVSDIKTLSQNYPNLDATKVIDFIIERIYQFFPQNPSLIKAILVTNESDIVEFEKKLNALEKIIANGDLKEISTTFKRVANIIKDMDLNKNYKIDEALFETDEEKSLYGKFQQIQKSKSDSYEMRLSELFSLKEYIDNFFDKVMVNVDDINLKNNRKALIFTIYQSFREIADIKEITI
ncbi:MAG: glycine--tRNA ligase subunit beta [Sulfurospirillum sp.]|nr:MAG: glycine--tRNA ligase subunit beta [Sulfurospirillum sp.]